MIVVELMGCIEFVKIFIICVLEVGKYVVIVNKDFLVVYGVELLEIVKVNKVVFYYEAVVVGGILIFCILVNFLVFDKIMCVFGVVNGIFNFMMIKMVEEGWFYDDVFVEV